MICMEKSKLNDADKAYAKAVGAALKVEKDRTKLTFDDLAEISGVPRATVSRTLYGTGDSKISDIRRIAEALDVPLSKIWAAADKATGKK